MNDPNYWLVYVNTMKQQLFSLSLSSHGWIRKKMKYCSAHSYLGIKKRFFFKSIYEVLRSWYGMGHTASKWQT